MSRRFGRLGAAVAVPDYWNRRTLECLTEQHSRNHPVGRTSRSAFLLPGGGVAYCRDSLRIGRQDLAALRVLLERAPRKEGRPGGPPHWAPSQLKAAAAEGKPSQAEKKWRRCNTEGPLCNERRSQQARLIVSVRRLRAVTHSSRVQPLSLRRLGGSGISMNSQLPGVAASTLAAIAAP